MAAFLKPDGSCGHQGSLHLHNGVDQHPPCERPPGPSAAAAGGKALLAEVDEAGLERLYRSPRSVITGEHLDEKEFAALLRELQAIRRQGYAVNNQETEPGVAAIGMTVQRPSERSIAALSVAAPASRMERLFAAETLELERRTPGRYPGRSGEAASFRF